MKRYKKLRIPMYYKIMMSFLGLLVCLTLILVISNRIAQDNAESYIRERMASRFVAAVEEMTEVLSANGWLVHDEAFKTYLMNYANRHDIKFEIYDLEDQLIHSSQKGGPGDVMVEGNSPELLAPKDETFFTEDLDIIVDGERVAYVKVRYFDPRVMNQSDLSFFEGIGRVFKTTILATMAITLIVSFFIARSITLPLRKVKNTAMAISEGDLRSRALINSHTTELIELSESINNLGVTLEREDLLRKQVTSDMAHEIRTPLTSLRNFFEAFIDGVYEPNEENMTKCHEEIIRITELVDRLKDLARIEEDNIVVHKEKVSLTEEVNTMCDLLMPEFEKKGISLSVESATEILMIMDRNHLRQIVSNLLTNAQRYTDEGGSVSVQTRRINETAVLSIHDTGIGMSEEDRKNIFERFYRADKSRDRATGGMGVGLTIVKKLVDAYDGSIEVDSRLGEGSEFVVKIPCL